MAEPLWGLQGPEGGHGDRVRGSLLAWGTLAAAAGLGASSRRWLRGVRGHGTATERPPGGSSSQPGVHKPFPVPRGSLILPSAPWEGHPRPSRPTLGHPVKPYSWVESPELGQAGGGELSPHHLGFPCCAHRCSGVPLGKKKSKEGARGGKNPPDLVHTELLVGRVAPCVQPHASSNPGLPRLDKQHFPPDFQLIPTQAVGMRITHLFQWPG